MSEVISVIGCGWLGLPLSQMLIHEGYKVHGSTTRKEKIEELEKVGIEPYLLNIYTSGQHDLDEKLFNCSTSIINIPPGRSQSNVVNSYKTGIKLLSERLRDGGCDRVIYVSTTGVYPNTLSVVDEETTPDPIKDSSKAVFAGEQIVQSIHKDAVILRMAGLVGGNRQPGKWFANKINIPGGETPVNMVHREDCLNIIKKLVETSVMSGIYNVCADQHPVKSEFYALHTSKLGLTIPTWQKGITPYKIISNQKLKAALKYDYVYPDPMKFL